jgi:hypothetical protein
MQAPESVRARRWHVHCFTFCKDRRGAVMVEFVRDVIIAVAVLATVVAVAAYPAQEADALGHGSGIGTVTGARLPVALDPGSASGSAVQAK